MFNIEQYKEKAKHESTTNMGECLLEKGNMKENWRVRNIHISHSHPFAMFVAKFCWVHYKQKDKNKNAYFQTITRTHTVNDELHLQIIQCNFLHLNLMILIVSL